MCWTSALERGARSWTPAFIVNPAARRIHLLTEQHIARARWTAEAAVHAFVHERLEGASVANAAGRAHDRPPDRPGIERVVRIERAFTARITSPAPREDRPRGLCGLGLERPPGENHHSSRSGRTPCRSASTTARARVVASDQFCNTHPSGHPESDQPTAAWRPLERRTRQSADLSWSN
jgi:hypothetical protein